MEAQPSHENNRLQAIEQKIKDVQDKLSTQLPAQYRHLAAMVCGTKWRLHIYKSHDVAAIVKKVRLELGAFDYRAKEQAELLTRYLIDLDGVLSYGNTEIQSSRKALVLLVQEQIPLADALIERSAKLKVFGERVLSGWEGYSTTPLTLVDSDAESSDLNVKALFEESEDEAEIESTSVENQEDAVNDYEMEESIDVKKVEPTETEVEDSDAVQDVDSLQKEVPRLHSGSTSQILDVDENLLPVWRPYYQLQRRQDCICLMARLNSIDPRNVRVRWNDRNGVLSITGFRLPTQKDIVMSRLSGAPTFGRFEIIEQFPVNMLNMEEATQQFLADGTLQIRMPYYALRHPLRYRPASLFQPQDCFVW